MVNKGLQIGLSREMLLKDDNILGLDFLSVLYHIEESWKEERITEEVEQQLDPRTRGLIRKASESVYHDIHGLAVLVDLINFLYMNKRQGTRHKDFLYVQEILEKYYTNLRSIYDFLANILPLAVDPKYYGQLSFDSFNSLLTKTENGKAAGKLPESAEKIILAAKESFVHVKDIRDSIIHRGLQLDAPMTKEDGYYLTINNENGEPGEQRLLDYLSDITKQLLGTAEDLASVVWEEYTSRYGKLPFSYVALAGVCIPDFVKFLDISKEEKTEN